MSEQPRVELDNKMAQLEKLGPRTKEDYTRYCEELDANTFGIDRRLYIV